MFMKKTQHSSSLFLNIEKGKMNNKLKKILTVSMNKLLLVFFALLMMAQSPALGQNGSARGIKGNINADNDAGVINKAPVQIKDETQLVCASFVGQVTAADPSTSLRSFRDGTVKTCAAPGACAGSIAGTFQYKILTWTNPVAAAQCVTVTYSTPTANFSFVTAFNGAPDLANLCTNWLSDAGSSASPGTPKVFSFNVPASATVNFLVTNITNGQTVDYSIVIDAPLCACTSVNPVPNQTVCNNSPTAAVNFTSPTPGTTFSWTNNNTSIGLAASGSGNIPSFTATNVTNAPVVATITVTPTVLVAGASVTQTFNYTGAMQTFTVPANVSSLTIDTYGAEGGTGATGGNGATGGVGGKGSKATGNLAVTTGQVLNIFVGGAGGTPTAGFNGGGTGGNANSGGGGGASDVRYPGVTPSDRLIVGSGGGGGGRAGCEPNTVSGGAGGNGDFNGANGVTSPNGGGGFGAIGSSFGSQGIGCGGFLGAPGTSGTALGIGGDGGAGQACCCFSFGSIPGGGGGGGGFIGGGGGGGGSAGTVGCSGNDKGGGGGGAGGFSYAGGVTSPSIVTGVQSGNGVVTITYIPLVPCTGTPTTFTITVNPTPTVAAQPNQTVCAGATTTATFTGAVAGTVYNWTNSNTAIGLGASGSGNISFTATNATAAPIVGTITVTPSYTNGGTTCTGTPTSFTITVNPNPTVNPVPNQTLCQGLPTAPINFTGAVPGTTFSWTNNTPAIGLAASGTGNIASFITLNPTAAPLVATITVTPATGLNGPITQTFNYTGAVQTFTIPVGITSVNIKAWGAQGNLNALSASVGGLGGYAEGNLVVTPGQTLFINTGGGATSSINGGFNGGGAAGVNSGCASAQGGGGGGASDVRITANTLANRVIVGAGGGGAGGNRVAGCGRGTGGGGGAGYYGGGGGAGWPGIPGSQGPVPTGGTQAAGGAGGITTFSPGPTNGFPGALGIGGAGGTEIGSNQGGSAIAEPGGIGGGLTGGSGLYNPTNNWCGQSGAGGSSYIGGVTGGLTTPGIRTGNGLVTITYTPPSATTCFGTPTSFTITVNPNPSLVIVADPGTTICEGDPTLLTVRVGSSSPIGTLYDQTGVAGNGSPSQVFEPVNTPFNSQSADDFTVPAGTTWTVTQITTLGINSGGGNPTSVNVFFYNNSGSNLPGTAIATFNNVATYVRTGANYTVTLPSSVVLVPGTYWVSFQVNMPFAGQGQWFWGNFGTTNIGNQYAWQNPGGGFGTPCTNWGYGATGCNVGGGVNRNNRFTIIGSSLADGGPLPPGYTFLWSPAAGLSSTTTNPVAASPMNTTTYTVNVNTAQGCTNQASILITVNKRPTVTTHPASRTNCAGTSATFTVVGTGTALTYQWQVSTTGPGGPWVNLTNIAPYSGVTTATLTVNPVTVAMNGYIYRCVLSGSCAPIGTANISNGAVLTVNPLPVVTVTPTVSCGSSAGVCNAITASGADTYTWSPVAGLFLDCAGAIPYIAGTNTATVYARPTAFTVYTVTGTFTATGCSNTAIALVNYTPPAPTVTPSSVAMCLGDPAVRLISSSATSSTVQVCSGPISVIVPDNNPAGNISNLNVTSIPASCNISAMSVTWNMNHTWDGDMVFALKAPNGNILNLDYYLSNTGGTGATTGFVNTTVSSTGAAALSSGSGTYTGTFKADALNAGIGGTGGPTGYTPTGTTWTQLYSVPNGTWTLAMKDGFGGDQGTLTSWCLNFTYVCGVPSTPATWSPIAGLYTDPAASIAYTGTPRDTVYARPTPAGVYPYLVTVQSLPPPPMTFSNPAPITINDNAPATPSPSNIVVSGLPTSGVTVQSVNINGFSHTWSGDVNIVLQSPNGPQNVILKGNSAGGDPFVVANNVNLTFSDAAAGSLPTTSPMASGTYKPTNYNPSPFSFLAPGPAGVVTPVFPASPTLATFTGNMNGTWKLFVEDRVGGDVGSISGGYSINFSLSAAACTSPARTVIVTVNQPTTITTQPVNQTICTDKVATFTVVAGGTGPFSYQWQVSTNGGNTWTNIANGGVYAGATTATLTVTAPPVSLSGNQYRVIVTGAAPCASATSFQALLTVNPLPTIVISASPYTSLFPGLTTTLTSTVTPNAAATYTWLRDGVAVSGATTGTLVRDVDGLGVYQLRVTDVNGCTNISNSITLKDSASGKCFIYPNPNSGQFQVRYYSVANNVLPRSLTIYDAKGDRVFTQFYTIGRPYDRMDVDMRAYGKGLYWVEIGDMNGNRITMCRVVIQ